MSAEMSLYLLVETMTRGIHRVPVTLKGKRREREKRVRDVFHKRER